MVRNIINKKYDFYVSFDIEKYEKYITNEVIEDIKIYKKHDLISPYIYSLCYMFLTTEIGLSNRLICNYLEEQRNINIMKSKKYENNHDNKIQSKNKKLMKE